MLEEQPIVDETLLLEAGPEDQGLRLDVFLAGRLEDSSRSFLKGVIKENCVHINNHVCLRPSRTIMDGDVVSVLIPPPPIVHLEPENIPLDIIYQDADVVVVNKQSGLVVHPAPGHYTGTLVHALLYHCPDFIQSGQEQGRPGIVHRIDRDTSGLLVIAKNPKAFAGLGKQAMEHSFDRRYLAIVRGEFVEDSGRIEAAIGRSITDRKKMSVTGVRGRDAVSAFQVMERFGVASLLSVVLETGRTHQIRVHLRFTGHPVVGDPVYGVTDFRSWPVTDAARAALMALAGQALHAETLGFDHPITGEHMVFHAPPPADFQRVLETLRG